MTERELRKSAAHKPDCQWWYAGFGCTCGLAEAFADDPDLVVLLRWLKTNQQTEERYLSEKRRRSEYDTHHRQGARNAFRDTIVTIEQSFGIRLTDDGWEWTEEATDATE